MGTIFVEIVLRKPFLAGETDVDQLKTIFNVLGTPTEEDWPVSHCELVDVCARLKGNAPSAGP
jgi:cyclin-dependent kinase 7